MPKGTAVALQGKLEVSVPDANPLCPKTSGTYTVAVQAIGGSSRVAWQLVGASNPVLEARFPVGGKGKQLVATRMRDLHRNQAAKAPVMAFEMGELGPPRCTPATSTWSVAVATWRLRPGCLHCVPSISRSSTSAATRGSLAGAKQHQHAQGVRGTQRPLDPACQGVQRLRLVWRAGLSRASAVAACAASRGSSATAWPCCRRTSARALKHSITWRRLRTGSHQADAPGVAFERTEAAADLDAVGSSRPRRVRASSTPCGIRTSVSSGRRSSPELTSSDAECRQPRSRALVSRDAAHSGRRALPSARRSASCRP